KKDVNFAANYEFTVEITDKKRNINKIESVQEEIIVSKFEETNSFEETFLKDFNFEISPGEYDVRLIITDKDLQKSISKIREIDLKDFWKEKVEISDVLLYVNDDSNSGKNRDILIPEPNIDIDYNSVLVINYYIFKSNPENNVSLNSKIAHRFYQDSIIYEESDEIYDKGYLVKRRIELTPDLIPTGSYIFKINAAIGETKIEKELNFSPLWENYPISEVDIELIIEQMKYIFSDEEYEKTTTMNRDEMSKFFNGFWSEIDIDTTTGGNEVMEEYFRRVSYANQNFTDPDDDGWESDRGKIWILYGVPDKILDRHNIIPPYETWEYDNINRRYIFWDEFSTGIFKLKSVYSINR
ncbi:GWxTD domain-containing protein, partial [candidate division KSB1 bacterium]